jgi:hypothetical protein
MGCFVMIGTKVAKLGLPGTGHIWMSSAFVVPTETETLHSAVDTFNKKRGDRPRVLTSKKEISKN